MTQSRHSPITEKNNLADVPRYAHCSLRELYDTLNHINANKYPEAFDALDSEIRSRPSPGYSELMECWSTLKRESWPEFTALLEDQIRMARDKEGIPSNGVLPTQKYQTFWRRFWAGFLDALVFIPFDKLDERILARDLSMSASILWSIVSTFAFSAYIVFMHMRYGQTLGKMLTGVTVLNVEPEVSISPKQAGLRESPIIVLLLIGWIVSTYAILSDSDLSQFFLLNSLIGFAAIAWFLLEVFTMLFNEKRRALHDFIAATVVVRDT